MASTRSIHFPPAAERAGDIENLPPVRANVLESYAGALRSVETCRELLRGLVVSEGRHGDLQAALSAARQLEGHLLVLIEAEEL
jgi:hypothetical protein